VSDQHEPAKSGMAAQIIARNARVGAGQASSAPTALDYCNGEMNNCLDAVDDLERREALLTNEYAIARNNVLHLSRTTTEQATRIAELEATNAALREFVAAADEWTKWCVCCMDEYEPQFRPSMDRYRTARQNLATDHSIPLPGQEGGG